MAGEDLLVLVGVQTPTALTLAVHGSANILTIQEYSGCSFHVAHIIQYIVILSLRFFLT